MKNRLWSLYLAQLNVHYAWSSHKYYYLKKRQRLWEPILAALALLPLALLLLVALWRATETIYFSGLALAQPHLVLVYGALTASLLGLIFGFFFVISTFYFSSDLSLLVALPLRSWEILSAKLGVVLSGQYLFNALILGPIWLRYGLLAKVGWGYLFTALLAFLALPVVPLVLATLFTVLLMRFVNLSRHKDKLTFGGGLLFVLGVVGFQIWLQTSVGKGDPEVLLSKILSQADGLVRIVGGLFPTSYWAAQALAYFPGGQGWLNLLYLLGVSSLGLALLYFVGEWVFIRGLVLGLEGSKGGRACKASAWAPSKPGSVLGTLIKTEVRLFCRNPGYVLNGLVGYVLLPVFALLPLFSKNLPGNPWESLAELEFAPSLVLGGTALFFMLMASFSTIPSTTFSREGKHLWIMRSLPLSARQVILGRLGAAQLVNTLGCLLALIPLAFLFGLGALPVLTGSFLGVCLAGALSCLLIFLDLWRPMLDWVNPIKAVKSNLNVIIGLGVSFLLILGMGARLFVNFQKGRFWLIPLELVLLFLVLAALSFYLLRKCSQRLWWRIEGGI